jgi:hypothetical protein
MELQESYKVDLTGTSQHGFKKKISSSTLAMPLWSITARAVNDGKCGLLSSLDLSSAFDFVNVKLFLKRLRRATPTTFGFYKLAISLYKTHNGQIPKDEWVQLILI